MRRADLLALTPDDLATLANRGLVKRAQKDLESGQGPEEFDADEQGRVTATWPDGAVVTLDPGAVLNDRCCTCAAFTICRHIIGTVLLYQTVDPPETAAVAEAAWDPGAVNDEALRSYYPPAVWNAILNAWSAGVVAEVHRSHKPLARLHSSGVTLRFLVANDVRYVQCDCAEDSPCRHVPLAVWAFRELSADRKTGMVAANQAVLKAPVELRNECEALIAHLFQYGLGELPPNDLRAWETLAARLRRAGLIWPEQIVLEWLGLRQQYLERDARFDAADVVQRSAELLIRLRAICANTGASPQLFLRGAREDTNELGSARLIGLGTSVAVHRKSATVTTILQDLASGSVLSLRRETAGHEKAFSALAQAVFAKRFTFAEAGFSQMLVKGAKRSQNGEIALSRAAISLNPQAYEWEKLRAPVLVEGVEELRGHLENLLPASLRPRHVAQTFHVIPVARLEGAFFNPMSRRLEAQLADVRGEALLLDFPFYSLGRAGFLKLLDALQRPETKIRFVAGAVRQDPRGIVVTPSALITEVANQRQMLQPWIDTYAGDATPMQSTQDAAEELDSFALFRIEMMTALGEASLTGIANADPLMESRWAALLEQGRAVGLERFLAPAETLYETVKASRGTLGWDAGPAVRAAVEQAVLAGFL